MVIRSPHRRRAAELGPAESREAGRRAASAPVGRRVAATARGALAAATLLLATAALSGCASAPEDAVPERPTARALRIEIGDAAQVRCDGRDMNFERMLYEVRVAVRAAGGDVARLPWLDVRTPPAAGPLANQRLERLRDEAYTAGVRHIELSLLER